MTSRSRLRRRIEASVLAALFLALSLVVEIRGSMPGDERVLVELHQTFGTDLDDSMVVIGAATDAIPLVAVSVAIIAALAVTGRRPQLALYMVIVVVVAVGNWRLKALFARPRPDVRPIPESVSRFSYPSGHASNTLSLFAALVLVFPLRNWRATTTTIGVVAVVVVGFSRLATGAHYPSDILAAWFWVGAWALLVWSSPRTGEVRRRAG